MPVNTQLQRVNYGWDSPRESPRNTVGIGAVEPTYSRRSVPANRLMKNSMTFHKWAVGLLAMAVLGPVLTATSAPTPPIEWPRVIYRNGVTNTVYQPQLVSWDYY